MSLENLNNRFMEVTKILRQRPLWDFESFVKWAQIKWKKKLFFFILAVMAFKTYLKQKGWLWKKTLKGKHIYLTGGGMGIGRLMALKCAKLGAKMTLIDINMLKCNATCFPF